MYETNNLLDDEGKRVQYAALIDTMYKRLVETGPCPIDREEGFTLSGGEEKGQTVTCEWFQGSQSTSRCQGHLEGRLFCNSVCANFPNQVLCSKTVFPPLPFRTCTDSKTVFEVQFPDKTTKNKRCQWAERKSTAWRCKYAEGVKEACPFLCTNCCVDRPGEFQLLGNNRTKSCTWVANNTTSRCPKAPSRQHCPVTCGECTP